MSYNMYGAGEGFTQLYELVCEKREIVANKKRKTNFFIYTPYKNKFLISI